MQRHEIAQYLQDYVDDVRMRFSRALLRVENNRRREAKMPELPKSTNVWLPMGPSADLYLLTLDVWRLRYSVKAEFIIDALLTRFRYMRKLPLPTYPESIHLGLPANIMAGVEARKCIEERITKEFPNNEHIKSRQQPVAAPMPDLQFDTIEQMLAQYNDAVTKTAQQRRNEKVITVRAYRKVIA